MMDCDTTGIEPDLGLCKVKKLVGGGTMQIVNQTVPRALARLGYTPEQVAEIIAYIDENKTILGAPHLAAEHVPVFACSMGDNTIHYSGHVRMMAAVQPFISGAISKTVNMPEDATVEEVEQLHIDAWQLGVKAIAIYRDNCKVAQPLSTAKKETAVAPLAEGLTAAGRRAAGGGEDRREGGGEGHQGAHPGEAPAPPHLAHLRVPRRRLQGLRHRRRVRRRPTRRDLPADLEAGLDPRRHHGRLRHLGELRPPVRRAAAGLRRDAHQHPLRAGRHDRRPRPADRQLHPRLHLPPPGGRLPVLEERSELNILTTGERTQPTLPGVEETITETRQGTDIPADPPSLDASSPLLDDLSNAPKELSLLERAGVTDPAPAKPSAAIPPKASPQRRPLLHAVRRPDAARRLLPRLPQLRQHQRLQLMCLEQLGREGSHRRCRRLPADRSRLAAS